jgi:hypothetical protein
MNSVQSYDQFRIALRAHRPNFTVVATNFGDEGSHEEHFATLDDAKKYATSIYESFDVISVENNSTNRVVWRTK